jgi:hypothetical protein
MADALKLEADLAAYLNVVPKTYSLSVLAALVGYLIYKVNLFVTFRRRWITNLTLTVAHRNRYSTHQRPSRDSRRSSRLRPSTQTR